MPAFTFPLSSTRGSNTGEGEGRLINAFWEKNGKTLINRRVPGLASVSNTTLSTPRGMIDIDGVVLAAYSGAVWSGATGLPLTGTLTGTDGVTWARNNRSGGPDIVAVRESGGAFLVTLSAVSAYPDADLPSDVNSAASLDGYIIYTRPSGIIIATGLNTTAIDPLSFATAESSPDGLKRGIVRGGVYYAMGTSTIEPFKNHGDSPFPLLRFTSVIPVGLLTTMAVAGFGDGWDRNPYFVAHDGTVRELDGFDTKVVSTPDVERFIAASTVSTIDVFTYTFRGNAIVTVSSDQGTWNYNVTTGLWHERQSLGGRWRASRSVKNNGVWYVGDRNSTNLLRVSASVFADVSDPLTWTVEGVLKDFPARVVIPSAFYEFTKATGSVSISYSRDGGATWSTPITRSLANADKEPIRDNRLGISTQHGVRVRLTYSAGDDFSFLGASVPEPQARAA